jgi:hypothetical protein
MPAPLDRRRPLFDLQPRKKRTKKQKEKMRRRQAQESQEEEKKKKEGPVPKAAAVYLRRPQPVLPLQPAQPPPP